MDWNDISDAKRETIRKRSVKTLWSGGVWLIAATIFLVTFETKYGGIFIIPVIISWIVAAIFVANAGQNLRFLKHPPNIETDRAKAVHYNRNKPATTGEKIAGWVFVVLILWGAWKLYQVYQRDVGSEMDYVCFNENCSYIFSTDYSVNWEGTCLTLTDSGSPLQQCGGTIEITKYPPESFWGWIWNQGWKTAPNTTQ